MLVLFEQNHMYKRSEAVALEAPDSLLEGVEHSKLDWMRAVFSPSKQRMSDKSNTICSAWLEESGLPAMSAAVPMDASKWDSRFKASAPQAAPLAPLPSRPWGPAGAPVSPSRPDCVRAISGRQSPTASPTRRRERPPPLPHNTHSTSHNVGLCSGAGCFIPHVTTADCIRRAAYAGLQKLCHCAE